MKSQTLGLYYWMLIIISIIFTVESNAQNWRCGAIHPSNADYLASISTGNNVASGITVQRSLPIHFFVVRNTNGILPGNNTSLGSSSTLSTFMRTEIELANQAFGQASISFYISDIDFIDNSAWFNFDLAQISNIHSAYNDANAINVYLVNTLTSGDGGYAHFPGGSPSNVVFLSVSVGPKYVLAHELGHYFNLFHTFYDTFMDGPSNSAAYNGDCATTGDMMCDTPPEPVCNSNLS